MLHILLFLAAVALPPKPARYVTDNAGVLGDARVSALNEKLAQFERDTSDQVLVYVDRDLPADTTIEEMGAEAIRKWGVGQKGKDNGAILFVFTGAKKMRIEVGYGLESTLTDAKSKRITSTVMKPLMQRGDLAGGIEAGADAVLSVIRGAEFTGTGTTKAQSAPVRTLPCAAPLILFVVIAVLAVILILRNRRGGRRYGSGGAWTTPSSSSSSDSWSSSDSSSSTDSGFSGGGGDGGGGGSSDSW
jgi:uncharacterized protein